jgi:putative salt-induced outer membrane protein YdiY
VHRSGPILRVFLVLLGLPAIAAAAGWAPPPPPADEFDWIQLESGEWLKGEIRSMEKGELQFDSDKLGLHTFDLDDITFIRSSNRFDVLRRDRTVLTGPLEINATTAQVAGQEFPREHLTAFSPSATKESQHWSLKLAAGFTARRGNTHAMDLSYSANAARRTATTRLLIDYTAHQSSLDGIETGNNKRANLTFDKFTSDRAFIRLPSAEYVQDPFQNLSHRLTLGASYGYELVQKNTFNWNVTLGPAWQSVQFLSVQQGEDLRKDTLALVLTSHLDFDLTENISNRLDYRGQLTRQEVGETTHHLENVLSVDLTKQLDLELLLLWDRVAQPKADNTGAVPKPDDFRIALQLGLDL